MRRLALSTVAILACGLGLAACGGNGAGTGTSGGDKGTSSQGSNDASDNRDGGKTGTPLAGTDPCSLLKPADVPELNRGSGVQPKADGRRCEGDQYAVTIAEVDADGYAVQFEGSIVKPLPDIGGYKAGKMEDPGSQYNSCAVVLAVTRNQLVTVAVGYQEDPTKSCDVARKAATAIAGGIPH